MRTVFFAAYFVISLQLFSQAPASSSTIDGSSYDIATNSILGMHNFGLAEPMDYDEIDGSPYFYDDFVYSSGLRTSGELMDSLLLKYDLATFSFIAKIEDGEDIYVDTKQFREFILNVDGEEILFKRVDPKNPDRFYEIIYQDKEMTIYKSEEISMVKGEELGISKTNDRFFSKEKYLVKKGKEIERVKLKKKNLWKYFDENQQEILDIHIRENEIKLKKASDLRKLLSILPKYT